MSETATKARVLLLEDHPIVRQGLAQLINDEADLQIVGQADDTQSALKLVADVQPDVAVVDISLKDRSGLDVIKDMHAIKPDLAVLVLSMHDEKLQAERALRARHRHHGGQLRRQPERAARRRRVGQPRESLAYGHAGHHHAVRGNAAGHKLVPHFLGGHAVAIDRTGHPLAVGHEVGHRGGVRRHAASGCRQRCHSRGGRGEDSLFRFSGAVPGLADRAPFATGLAVNQEVVRWWAPRARTVYQAHCR